jgi:hypothetical protein
MNIKITKEEFDYIKDNATVVFEVIMGSRMYGTAKETSDTDILMVCKDMFYSDLYYPNYHQLQYDDVENNTQYVICTERQFYKNLFSGDATINADVVLYHFNWSDERKLNTLRTFNIIKAFIGFAKRDLKQIDKGKNKLFHIERGLYCAKMLIGNKLPNVEIIKTMGTCTDIVALKKLEEILRKRCNDLFDKGELTMFPKKPVIDPINSIEAKIIEANNIKEFKY